MLAAIDPIVSASDAGLPFAGIVDGSRQALAGHSAGGLSAFLAALGLVMTSRRRDVKSSRV